MVDLLAHERAAWVPEHGEALTTWLRDGGDPARTARRRRLAEAVAQDAEFAPLTRSGLDYAGGGGASSVSPQLARLRLGARMIARVFSLRKELGIEDHDVDQLAELYSAIPATLPTDLHFGVCVPFVRSQFTQEQQAEFLFPMLTLGHIYAYAQTELAHGSNVRGLETTASYLPDTDEFELHSPDASSTKWWPGCMGVLSTHVICMARLKVAGTDYGITPFVVPVRDVETHRPLPGVEIGSIGPTGYELVDNGFLKFSGVRIPRTNMAMKNSQVDRDGKFTRAPAGEKLAFGGMLAVRALIVRGGAGTLGKAVTIATRYSAIRRQFGSDGAINSAAPSAVGTSSEIPVLDYTMQQYRLLPLLSAVYALTFVGKAMQQMHEDLQSRLRQGEGDTSTLAEVHATSAGLKAFVTWIAGSGIEECRKCCGGHGYSRFAGFWSLFENYVGVQTAEGDNFLLTQQTAKFLLKLIAGKAGGGLTAQYMTAEIRANEVGSEPTTARAAADDRVWQLQLLQRRSCSLALSTAESLQKLSGGGASDPMNLVQVELMRMSQAHCLVVVVESFQRAVDRAQRELPKEVADHLASLCSLFSLYHIEQQLGDLIGELSASGASAVRGGVRLLLETVRPHAVPLVDALDHHDFQLRSAIGCRDGRAYERLVEWAKLDPTNSPKGQMEGGQIVSELRSTVVKSML